MAQSIYDKYGGFATVSTLVERFYEYVTASPSLAPYFEGVDMPRLIGHQTQFLCKVLGGPDNYEGRSLRAAHIGLRISPEAFAEVAQHLKSTLEGGGVVPEDVAAVLALVASTRSEIVEE